MPASAAASRSARDRALYDDDGGMAPRIRRRTSHATPVSAWRRAAHARSRRHQQLSSAIPSQKILTAQMDRRGGRASKYHATAGGASRNGTPRTNEPRSLLEAEAYARDREIAAASHATRRR